MKSIKVGNLDLRVTEDDLRHLFGRFGAIAGIQLYSTEIINRFAVIVFYESESAKQAKVLDGLKVGDYHITVE